MLVFLSLLLLSGDGPDIEKAQGLYQKARYEQALKALGKSCEGSSAVLECERLRAFVLIALGREPAARAAFGRMLMIQPGVTLGADVSPKIQALFDAERQLLRELTELVVELVNLKTGKGEWLLKVKNPQTKLNSLTLKLGSSDGTTFEDTPFKLEADAWIAGLTLPDLVETPRPYYLVAELPSGVLLFSGSEHEPLSLRAEVAKGPLVNESLETYGDSAVDSSPSPEPEGLPRWALWTMVAGGAVLVASGVVLALLLTREPKEGSLEVSVEFQD